MKSVLFFVAKWETFFVVWTRTKLQKVPKNDFFLKTEVISMNLKIFFDYLNIWFCVSSCFLSCWFSWNKTEARKLIEGGINVDICSISVVQNTIVYDLHKVKSLSFAARSGRNLFYTFPLRKWNERAANCREQN